ncbi:MAG TPA: helix-turn-helix transcriptional regulator [Candidatus Paceibacterota bacterium]|nr:helix-turn-helix transcriptional regulator [Candidatus Paceibacterota bacterium]
MKKYNVIFGNTIKKFRKEKNLTQTACAKKLKITQAQWSAYEVGKTGASIELIFSISKVLKIHPVVLICSFFADCRKCKQLRSASFNEYMEILNLAPNLVVKDKITIHK